MRLFVDACDWEKVSCADPRVFEIFKRHYSFRNEKNRDGKNGKRVVGPGEEITLLSIDRTALFVWRKELFRMDGQEGINCAIFRNEGKTLSSVLINQAEEIAWRRWPTERLFTFVNSGKIQSANPGYCFKKAGWRQCGKTKMKGLIILEKLFV